MRTDDVGSRSRCSDQHLLDNFSITCISGQTIVLGARALEGVEEHDGHVLEPPLPHVLRSLLHTLSPIDIGIVQECRPSCGAAGHFIEVGNIVRECRNARPGVPHKQCCHNSRSRSCHQKLRYDAAHPNENEREYRKNVANADLTGENRRRHQKKSDANQQEHLAPAVDEAPSCFNRTNENKYKRGKRCLESKGNQKVVPPPSRLQLSEQIKRIIFQMVGELKPGGWW